MGLLEDALSKVAPGGNVSKPLMIALGALLVHSMMGGSGSSSSPTLQPSAPAQPDGGHVGGLGGLLNKLEQAGHGNTVKSWVGPGSNPKPIEPGQLGQALGPKTVQNVAQQSGLSEQQLLQQLAQALPGVVSQLTKSGQIPSLQQLAQAFSQR